METLFDKIVEDKMQYKVKFADDDNFYFQVVCEKCYDKRMSYYFDTTYSFEVNCYDKDGREAGDMCFDITDPEALHIEDVEVISSYRHHGLGTKMLRIAEYTASQYGLGKLDGLFAPQDEEKAKKFYNNNGYRVVKKDGCICIVKKLGKKQEYDDISLSDFAKYVKEEEIEV